MSELKFPQGFLWGAATAAHQIEGNNTNSDWWEWEQKSAGLPGGPAEASGIACDSYNRFDEDFAIAQDLGHTATRLSLEWARLEPREGEFDLEQVEHYKKVLLSAKNHGLKTFVTLHHFTNPIWFAGKGGWLNMSSPKLFTRYAQFCYTHFSELVDYWITVNEPTILTSHGYLWGIWPPQKKNLLFALMATLNLMSAHRGVYDALKKDSQGKALIGFSHHITDFERVTKNPIDLVLAAVARFAVQDLAILFCFGKLDWLGINYYIQYKVANLKFFFDYSNGRTEYTPWPIAPEGLSRVLIDLKKYKLPLYITENGIADANDAQRGKFITQHLAEVKKAIDFGADVRGYLHWSLLDNFEWAKGFGMKFGLVQVQWGEGLKRLIRNSALVYKEIIKS